MIKLDESERQNLSLKQEITAQKRILNGQGKALNKMVNENDYPMKIKQILDELRHQKDKCKELEQQLRQAERMQSQLLQHNQTLERKNSIY